LFANRLETPEIIMAALSATSSLPLYRGRFAPSPTGPLHFGSLVAALGSYLHAKRRQGEWLLRMEDVDEPRCTQQAASAILHSLEAYGFAWDGAVLVQSQRKARYQAILADLIAAGRVFPCACTRTELVALLASAGVARAIDGGLLYPGVCRNGLAAGRSPRAWRLRVADVDIAFEDGLLGHQSQNLQRDVGDFVLLRADGYFAYQLAVVVDDADQGISHVVRGADLLDSTPRQIYLQQALGFAQPQYVHLPLVLNTAGEKLSKQTLAPAVNDRDPLPTLLAAARFLGETPDSEIATLAEF
jgi:glutamyl-Q tRNA(Asp) synthetase